MKLSWLWTRPSAGDLDWRKHMLFLDRVYGFIIWTVVLLVLSVLIFLGLMLVEI